ncbi:hypothetical protein ACF0H5_017981 [Mactra antiquata]
MYIKNVNDNKKKVGLKSGKFVQEMLIPLKTNILDGSTKLVQNKYKLWCIGTSSFSEPRGYQDIVDLCLDNLWVPRMGRVELIKIFQNNNSLLNILTKSNLIKNSLKH